MTEVEKVPERVADHGNKEANLSDSNESGDIPATINERALIRKLDLTLLPALTLLYLLSFLG